MAYANGNPRTKKQLKEWIAAGKKVRVYQPGGMFNLSPGPNKTSVEGPHYPEPHRWYAQVEYDEDFIITKIK